MFWKQRLLQKALLEGPELNHIPLVTLIIWRNVESEHLQSPFSYYSFAKPIKFFVCSLTCIRPEAKISAHLQFLFCLTWVFSWILVWMYQCKVSGGLLGERCWDENTSESPTPQWWNIQLHNYSNSVAYAFSKNPPLSRENEGNLQHPVVWELLFGPKEMAGGNWHFSSPTCIVASRHLSL